MKYIVTSWGTRRCTGKQIKKTLYPHSIQILHRVHLWNPLSSWPFFSNSPLPTSPSPPSCCPLPISPFPLPPSSSPLPPPSLTLHVSPFPLPTLARTCRFPIPVSPSPLPPSPSPPPHSKSPTPAPHPLPPSCPPSPGSLQSPALAPKKKKYLHLNQDMLQLLLSFCSFTHLRWCLRPTAPSPHSSSGDFTSILQISAC